MFTDPNDQAVISHLNNTYNKIYYLVTTVPDLDKYVWSSKPWIRIRIK